MPPRKLTAEQCPQCSAPLSVGPNDTDVKCHYCGNSIRIERAKPPTEIGQAPSFHTLYVDPNVGRGISHLVWLGVAVPVLVPLFVTLGPFVARHLKSIGGTSFPTTCGLNEELDISGTTFSGSGTLINAELNCKVNIKNSRLTGDVVVKSSINATITLENSTIEGRQTALELGTNGHVRAVGNSSIKSAGGNGIEGGVNLEITLEDSKIETGRVAVHGDVNTSVSALRAEIAGQDAALELGNNGKLKLAQTTVRGGTAVTGAYNLEINADRATFRGEQKWAIHGGNNAKVRLRNKSALFAKRNGIEGDQGLEIIVDDSTVEAGDIGIRGVGNAAITINRQGKVKGTQTAISAGNNLELATDQGTIESQGIAVEADGSARIDAQDSTIRGGASSFALKRAPSAFSVKNTTIVGSQNFPKGR
jgi:hypothetical protein